MVSRVNPDIVSWQVTVSEQDFALPQVKARGDQKTQEVLRSAKELGVPPEDLQTGYLSIHKEFNEIPPLPRTFKGWSLTRSITFKERDLARFDQFLETLLANAEVEVNYSLETSRYHELREETRIKAVGIARQKAQAMCEALGAKLGKPITVSTENPNSPAGSPWWPGASNAMSNGSMVVSAPAEPDSGTFAPGTVEIRETVYVTFAIE
jgi:uncharacterized protein YggE